MRKKLQFVVLRGETGGGGERRVAGGYRHGFCLLRARLGGRERGNALKKKVNDTDL